MNAEERTKAISSAILYSYYGKLTQWQKAAFELNLRKTQHEYRAQAKEALLWLAINDPERLLECANELCWLKGGLKHDKCPRGRYFVEAYEACASFPPTLSEVKHAFIVKFGEKKWNGGHDDKQSRGDSSARKTLKILGLPLKEKKKGRPVGSKSLTSGPQGLREGIAKK